MFGKEKIILTKEKGNKEGAPYALTNYDIVDPHS
jgi:hypothetical protein